MKKARTVVTVMIVLAAVLLGLHPCRPKYRYDVWKDSHEVYGDAEYQLMTDPDHSYSLYNHAISHMEKAPHPGWRKPGCLPF